MAGEAGAVAGHDPACSAGVTLPAFESRPACAYTVLWCKSVDRSLRQGGLFCLAHWLPGPSVGPSKETSGQASLSPGHEPAR